MSECVVRMEMPENCTCCPMCFTADMQGYHWCAALEQEVEEGLSRSKECPIICSIPEWHGRLVDVAVLKNKNMRKPRGVSSYDYGAMATVFMDMINDTPTVVPAERSET